MLHITHVDVIMLPGYTPGYVTTNRDCGLTSPCLKNETMQFLFVLQR